jgi:hypothetical protein
MPFFGRNARTWNACSDPSGHGPTDLTGGEGVDRVVETFGPETIEQSMRASAMHGQIVLLIARSPNKASVEISGGTCASSLTDDR